MSRKAPTQRELEIENRDLRMQVNALRRRLKQTVRQVQNFDNYLDVTEVKRELEAERDLDLRRKPRDWDDKPQEPEYIEFTLPNGDVRRVPKRMSA